MGTENDFNKGFHIVGGVFFKNLNLKTPGIFRIL